MALGDSNQNQNKQYGTTYWSRWSIKQRDGKLRLSPRFSQGLLTLDVSQQAAEYKWDSVASITLSPTKAKVFAAELRKFLEDFNSRSYSGKAYGVDTGIKDVRPIIAITASDSGIILVIGKVNPDGSFESRLDYSINTEYHYGLEWSSLENMEVDKTFYDTMEVEQLIELCDEFAANAYGACASATLEMMKWDYSVPKNLEAVATKLGVKIGKMSNNSKTGSGNSFFNKNDKNNGSTKRSSLEDLEDELG